VYETEIPQEIKTYFSSGEGKSLLVKGDTGTGKSTFALSVLKELGEKKIGVAVFTRLEKDEIETSLPWVKKLSKSLMIFDRYDRIADANIFSKEFAEITKSNNISVFVIDTVEALIERFDNPNRKLKDLVYNIKSRKVNSILIQEEKGISYIDYLVGGIVTLSKRELEGRTIRSISIDKLRGVEIKQPRYTLTLKDGVFRSFGPYSPNTEKLQKWETKPDPDDHFSTGIPDLDVILGGGYKRGSYNVIEVADNVSQEEYRSIIRPMILNFLSQKRGVVGVLIGGDHPESLRNDTIRFLDAKNFDSYMRVADYFITESDKPYIMALGGPDNKRAIQVWTETIKSLRGDDNKPIMDFTGFDTVEYIRGETIALRELLNGVAATKISNDLGLGIIKPGLKLTQGIKNMADTFLKIIDIDNTCCIYGDKPQTVIYTITPDHTMGYPNVCLSPLV